MEISGKISKNTDKWIKTWNINELEALHNGNFPSHKRSLGEKPIRNMKKRKYHSFNFFSIEIWSLYMTSVGKVGNLKKNTERKINATLIGSLIKVWTGNGWNVAKKYPERFGTKCLVFFWGNNHVIKEVATDQEHVSKNHTCTNRQTILGKTCRWLQANLLFMTLIIITGS